MVKLNFRLSLHYIKFYCSLQPKMFFIIIIKVFCVSESTDETEYNLFHIQEKFRWEML